MSVKPILFNTDMVRAILDGRKTVTRRAIKSEIGKNQEISKNLKGKFELYDISPRCGIPKGIFFKPPYQPGDIIYVRETWLKDNDKYYYRASFNSDYLDPCETLSGGYPAYCKYHPGCDGCMAEPTRLRWHPSIHMPKEAARIWLKVKDVRVERLQDMTEKDAISEGITDDMAYSANGWKPTFYDPDSGGYPEYIKAFSYLWDSTIKKKDLSLYGWDASPWVWLIEFESTVKPNE